ncbi:MAG: type II toxin-antitoxin system RelE/ParE family toxin [Deltaproteobacteria bacterium]|nr:type II toxin-antitoxin system RelE/ParE family toxin [Deltaproteobacteria bacterium]
MANKYTIRYLPAAVDDLVSIFDWIAYYNPANAATFVEKLDRRIGALRTHPFLGHTPKDDKLTSSGYRVLAIESYLAFYVVYDKTVEIHRVVHGSRNLDVLKIEK